MQRQICWVERLEDGVKREVRVTVSRDRVRWQFKRDDEERWVYDGPVLPADWDELLTRVENRYQRRTASHADLVLVRRLRDEGART